MALDAFQHPRTDPADGGRLRAELEMKAAYLSTFAKVSRAALHAALDVTAREFDRLLGASASRERVQSDLIKYGSLRSGSLQHGPAGPASVAAGPVGPAPIDPALIDPALLLRPVVTARPAAAPAGPERIVMPDTQAAELAGLTRWH
jgi:hypothetical protein